MAVSQAVVGMASIVSVDLDVLEGLATVKRLPCTETNCWVVSDMVRDPRVEGVGCR